MVRPQHPSASSNANSGSEICLLCCAHITHNTARSSLDRSLMSRGVKFGSCDSDFGASCESNSPRVAVFHTLKVTLPYETTSKNANRLRLGCSLFDILRANHCPRRQFC